MTQQEFNTLIKSFMLSTKITYDLSHILSKNTLHEIKKLTEAENGYFIDSKDVIAFLFNNENMASFVSTNITNNYKDKISFFIIAGYDIQTNKRVIRFSKTLS